jgi:HD-like signal output (HDOD) protein
MQVSVMLIVLGGILLGIAAGCTLYLYVRTRNRAPVPDIALPPSVDPGAVPEQSPVDEPEQVETPVEDSSPVLKVSPHDQCLNIRTISPEIKETLETMTAALPRLPHVGLDLLPILAKPGTGTKEVAEVVQRDQVTAARLLRWVNSSMFGLEGQVDSLHRAVTLLGIDIVRSAVLEDAIGRSIAPPAIDGLGPETIWRHAAAVSVASKHLAVSARGISPDVAATAGLLHDIGFLLMLTLERDGFRSALRAARADNQPLIRNEDSCVGFNHQVWGEIFIRSWKLPEAIAIAIGSHHCPLVEPSDPLAALLWLADYIVSKFGFACPEDMIPTAEESEIEELLAVLGLRPSLGHYVTDGLLRELVRATRWYWPSKQADPEETELTSPAAV